MKESLESYIALNAQRYPDRIAVICGDECCTYAQFNSRIDEMVAKLQSPLPHSGGGGASPLVCLRASASIDFLVSYFALHRAGFAVAPMERDMPPAAFEAVEQELSRHPIPEGTADVLYTTGTTGKSKGVLISHRTIIADAENLIAGQGFSHDLTFVVNGPLNHIGSLSKIYPVVMLGATLVIVDGLKDVNAFFDAFSTHLRVEGIPARYATFLVPASIRILIQFSADRLAALADRMDFIETGAAAISQADMQTLCSLLPHTRLYNTYASTETGIISTYNFNDGRCQAGCLGHTMPHSYLFITEQGTIACQGDTLMTGYIGDPERTATVLRDNTLFTSDLGRLDDEGMLHLAGRQDDVINVGGFKVAPTEVEDAAMAYPLIKDCICIPVEHKITGTALKLLVVMLDGHPLDKRALALHLKSRLEPYKIPLLYEAVPAIQRTFNGKLNRKAYMNPSF